MWRLYVGGLCMGFALGGAACWLVVLLILPESTRGILLANPAFPWMVFLTFGLAGENVRIKAKKASEPDAASDPACKQGQSV